MQTHSSELDAGCIAIVGLAGRFPAARSVSEFWTLLREGREAMQWLTGDELRAAGVSDSDLANPEYVRASLVLPDMEMFDAEFFGFSKRDAAVLDPQHRHFLECAWEALEDAGHMPEQFSGAIGVFGGCGMQAYLPYNLLTNPKLVESMGLFLLRHTGNDKDFLCSRVSYLLNLKGPSLSVQTACSTSLVAVHVAAQSLLSGECDMALAGGVSIELPHRHGYRYAQGEILAPDGHCRAFDDDAAGTVFGSGAGIVVLRRLEDAIKDRDNIYAVIRGSAVNNDGSEKAGYLAPSVDGQARAAVEALAVAGVDPASVSYIEAHGTGTPVGDPIEIAALTQAYGGDGGRGFCGIGSVKTNIGHLDTAASVASLIKVSLALRHGVIPASLNFSRPNSRIDIASTPFYVVDKPKAWAREDHPRRAAVNALGVGGVNAHVVLEEPPLMEAEELPAGSQVFTLSARTPASLERLKGKWHDFLAQPPAGFDLADAAYTTQAGRRSFEHRCAIVANDVQQLRAALASNSRIHCTTGKAATPTPAVVFMFPGGGAHYPGAGRQLLSRAAFRSAVDDCFSLMPADVPRDLRALMFDCDPQDAAAVSALQRPVYALPALFTLEHALTRLWENWGITPAAVIGHSAGDYAAACCAGVMSLADALSIAALRGQLFEAAPPGAMLSVDLPEASLRRVMSGLELDLASVNAPDLCVASGSLASISQLEQRLADQGMQGRRVHINVAAHSHLLDGVLDTFRERVSRIRLSAPTVPFISNLNGTWADAQALTDPEYWVRHLREPVRFSDGLRRALDMPGAILLESGPGQGLCALARQNSVGQPRVILPSTCKAHEPNADLALMLTGAGALWTHGVAPGWQAIRGPAPRRRISLPTYAFDHQRHWIEPGILTRQESPPAQEVAAAESRGIKRLDFQDDWFRVPQWRAAPYPGGTSQPGRKWLVFGTDSKLCADIVSQLTQEEGGSITLVRRSEAFGRLADGAFTLEPGDAAHYAKLFETLATSRALPDHILYLWALDTTREPGSAVLPGQALAFDSLVHIAKAIQRIDADQPIRLTVVTTGSQAVMNEAVPHPEQALALGPCRVIPREIPNIVARLIDVAPSELAFGGIARCILSEAQATDDTDLVAYRSGERRILQLLKAAPPTASALRQRLRPGGVYLITGGLGDIGLELAAFLASTVKARLALVSRRAFPPSADWKRLAAADDGSTDIRVIRRLLALEDYGTQVLVLSANAADRGELSRAVNECRERFGAINGAFHTAGAIDDAPIATKSAQSIKSVLEPKAYGAQVLHELLPPGGELDLFAVFSSTSVYLGAAGQVDYTAANAFLDSLAGSRADGLCIHWGIWGDKGMSARAHGYHDAAGKPSNVAHPLLGTRVDSANGVTFETTYDPADLWVLHEHVIAGRPVLPGTAYIEIARAAMASLHPRAAVEIRALSFEEAMVFNAGALRRVRIEMRRSGPDYDFLVYSRGGDGDRWQEHAHAHVGVFAGTLPVASPIAAGTWRRGELPQKHAVAFGDRWNSIVRMRLAKTMATAEMELPARFARDLSDYAAHPAITDAAATFGLHLLGEAERRGQLFVPLSIERIRLVAPVSCRSISRVELKEGPHDLIATFDVSLHASDGSPIATFEGFSLRGVQADAVWNQSPARSRRKPALLDAMLCAGIKAEDSHALFERIFSGAHRDLVVSSIELADLKRAMADELPQARVHKSDSAEAAEGDALNPVERAIAEIWRELLGLDDIAGNDDFFALGGHSLAAVRLFARIRKQFAVDLPLATLFQAPTLAALAAIVAQIGGLDTRRNDSTPEQPAASATPPITRDWSPLVAICTGRPERRPLFCVHGAGGNVLNFKVISDRLGPDQPFYGLQAQGVDGRLAPLATIEEMAAQYLAAIRSVDPVGPYRLAGYSAGGLIAFEMAQQLKRAGAQVLLLAMIDTLCPTVTRRRFSLLRKLWQARHWSLKFALEWPVRRRKVKLDQAGYGLALEKISNGEPLPPELVDFHLFRNFIAAQDRYQPVPYDGAMVLFKAAEAELEFQQGGRSLGWKEHIRGEIRIADIPGSHHSMMAEPGVSLLIEGLRKELAMLDENVEIRRVGWGNMMLYPAGPTAAG
jgi:acyl transferase domain-containing protein/thioesterase domain-containing protein/acyl carrier protein